MPDPDGFNEEPQSPLALNEDEETWDESIWGPKKTLTAEEQAEYDAWFRRKVQEGLEDARRPDAVFYSNEEVWAHVDALIERLDREAGLK